MSAKAYLAAAAIPGFFILLAITLAMVGWAWDERRGHSRPPSTCTDDETPED